MNIPDAPPDPAASICWFLGGFHLLLPHPRAAKAAELPWSPFPAEFPAVQSSHSRGITTPAAGNPPSANRCQREPAATHSPGTQGHQLCWEIRAAPASELEGRKRGENAKYSTQVLFLVALHALICDESYGSTGWSSTGLLKQMQEHISC